MSTDDVYEAVLTNESGGTLPLEGVQWEDFTRLRATVPSPIEDGSYRIVVTDPTGKEITGTLKINNGCIDLGSEEPDASGDASSATDTDSSTDKDANTDSDTIDDLINDIGDSYTCHRTITIDHTKVSTIDDTDLKDFPLLVHIDGSQSSDLAAVGVGGCVTSKDGFDIVFTNEDSSLQLDHEIEAYDNATGELNVWVKVPYLFHDTDVIILMHYGDPNIDQPQQNPALVWNSDFQAVYHANLPTHNVDLVDSTSNGHTLSPAGGFPSTALRDTAGKIGRSVDFQQSGEQNLAYMGAQLSDTLNSAAKITVECWIKPGSQPLNTEVLMAKRRENSYLSSWEIHLSKTDRLLTYSWNRDGNVHSTITPAQAGWNHIVVVADGDTSIVSFYLNGVLRYNSYGAAVNTTTERLWVGGFSAPGSYPIPDQGFNGAMDEIRISAEIRTADWISTTFANQNSPNSFYTIEPL